MKEINHISGCFNLKLIFPGNILPVLTIKVALKPERLVFDNIPTKLKEDKFNTYPAFHRKKYLILCYNTVELIPNNIKQCWKQKHSQNWLKTIIIPQLQVKPAQMVQI